MPEPVMPEQQQFYVLASLHGLAGIFWLIGALSAFSGFQAFKQTLDLWWTFAFFSLALVQLGYVWAALQYAESVEFATREAIDLARITTFYGVRFTAIEVAATFALIYLFRARRRSF